MTQDLRDTLDVSLFIQLSESENDNTIEDSPEVDELVAAFEQGGEL